MNLGFEEDWLVVDLQPDPDVPLEVPDIGQWCNPARPTTMVPGGPGYRRWEFMRLPHETLEALQDEEKVWALLAPWVTPATARLVRHAVYQFRSRIAQNWRHGRVLLAGDTAHLMPPFPGQSAGAVYQCDGRPQELVGSLGDMARSSGTASGNALTMPLAAASTWSVSATTRWWGWRRPN